MAQWLFIFYLGSSAVSLLLAQGSVLAWEPLGFLYRVHRQDLTRPRSVSMAYDDHPEFNDRIDEQSEPVQILSLPPYQPSDVLFNVDLEAYRDLLAEYETDVAADEVAESADEEKA